jgi:hypothetical protein
MEPRAVWCKRFLAWATVGLISSARIAGTLADGPAKEFRSFSTDFRTLCECIHKVEHDLGLRESGTPHRLRGEIVGANLKLAKLFNPDVDQPAIIIIDREKLPHVEPHQIHVAMHARWSRTEHPHLGCTIKLDPDTGESKIDPDSGELSESAGFELVGFRARSIQMFKHLVYDHGEKQIRVEIARHYPSERVEVQITSREKDGPAICRELMASLDSKLRLATKLKDAREKRTREEMHRKPTQRISEEK